MIKQDGVFVCQSCGTKYSIEEAKKTMVEGTVEIVGTVRIDNSGSYDKFIGLARDAFEDSRYESAYDYCSKALDVNAENPEMILLQGLSLLGKDSIPEAKDVTELEEKAKKLAADKQALGFFKGKEKKSIQMQIDEIEVKKAQVGKVVSKKTDELQQKINAAQEETREKNAPLLTRVKEIESELTKER